MGCDSSKSDDAPSERKWNHSKNRTSGTKYNDNSTSASATSSSPPLSSSHYQKALEGSLKLPSWNLKSNSQREESGCDENAQRESGAAKNHPNAVPEEGPVNCDSSQWTVSGAGEDEAPAQSVSANGRSEGRVEMLSPWSPSDVSPQPAQWDLKSSEDADDSEQKGQRD